MTAAIRAVLVDRHQNRKFLFLALVGCEHANSSASHLRAGFACFFFSSARDPQPAKHGPT